MTTLPLQDRVAIVTGASRGIGKAIAEHLASLGARVVINYSSSAAAAESLAAQLNSSPPKPSLSLPRAIAVHCDVSDETQVKSLFAAAESAFKTQPHILVTSAGILDATYSPISETNVPSFDKIMAVNARGTFLCVKEAASGKLKKGGGGRIVTISSSLAGFYKPGYGAYTASKAAVEAMTKIVAKEMKGSGVTANCVAPGPVATEMFFSGKTEEEVRMAKEMNPMGRLGETEDVAKVVGFLVTDEAEWVNGQVIRVNGGYV